MTEVDKTISRVLFALSLACIVTAAVFAIQAVLLGTPAAPWLGQGGAALLASALIYEWLTKRVRRSAGGDR